MQLAREKAAQAWCKPWTKHKVMDTALAEAFAEILEEIWSQPWLGNATTGQLLDEIRARVDCNYRTVDEPPPGPAESSKAQEQYNELLYAVAQKFEGETRHETALRYIREREARASFADTFAVKWARNVEGGK